MPDSIMQTESPAEVRSIKDLAAALCKAQSEMTGASKETTNPHFNRKYADLASVWNAIRAPLTNNGLSVVQLLRSVAGGVEVETILLHSSGQQISDVFGVPVSKADAQGYGSAATYARRYSLMAMVGVAPEDDDGNEASSGYKPAQGSAGAGGDFRPAGPRRFTPPKGDFVEEARQDGTLDTTRAKGTLPAKPSPTGTEAQSAIKRIEWVKKSVADLKMLDAEGAKVWWTEQKARIDVIETALPTEFERLLDAYNEALDRKAVA